MSLEWSLQGGCCTDDTAGRAGFGSGAVVEVAAGVITPGVITPDVVTPKEVAAEVVVPGVPEWLLHSVEVDDGQRSTYLM
ncbi:hypothetical protein NDU88_001125 [Pleurodeles waltl]|uniref:Uncharacterized protein n=1 Tax=Pleurodeles waltl TaxID=8319 RepID=A0AAV7LWQ8_PLEWA|nr:hypothetical protein NDU88_001125 [Pleurodeles waltl]